VFPIQHEKTMEGVASQTLPFQQKATQEKYTIKLCLDSMETWSQF
jgi:hypothetical protein